jgi:thymidylate synthase
MHIKVENVNEAAQEIFHAFKHNSVRAHSRNGEVYRLLGVSSITYEYPRQRVLFWPERDANPFFHLMESIWILAGRGDVEFPALFNSNIHKYSDDGVVFNSAYGTRMRKGKAGDQLLNVMALLAEDPNSRRAVIQLYDGADLAKDTLDVACNLNLVFEIVHNHLNMTVFNRSNDVYYGALGANVVHFSIIQEFLANALECEMGEYTQVSSNLHLYRDLYPNVDIDTLFAVPPNQNEFDYYALVDNMAHMDLLDRVGPIGFLIECEMFCADPFNTFDYDSRFISEVCQPMALAYINRKSDPVACMDYISEIQDDAWRIACQEWVVRRNK